MADTGSTHCATRARIDEETGFLEEQRRENLAEIKEDRLEGLAAMNPELVGTDRGAHAAPSASLEGSRLKILLVEDDFTSRILLQGLLRAYGDCHIAVNGEEAVEAFREARDSLRPYDLICMDVRMPGTNGVEAVRQIRALEESRGVYSTAGVTIFMTTAIGELKTVTASYSALCDAYLFKPIDGKSLEQQLLASKLIEAPIRN